jgi:hypothetical protein
MKVEIWRGYALDDCMAEQRRINEAHCHDDELRDRNILLAGASLPVLSLINIGSNQADTIGQ